MTLCPAPVLGRLPSWTGKATRLTTGSLGSPRAGCEEDAYEKAGRWQDPRN